MLEQPEDSISAIAARLGRCRSDLADQLRFSYLAPDIVNAIVTGIQPVSLPRKRLVRVDLPLDWNEQRRVLGFTAA